MHRQCESHARELWKVNIMVPEGLARLVRIWVCRVERPILPIAHRDDQGQRACPDRPFVRSRRSAEPFCVFLLHDATKTFEFFNRQLNLADRSIPIERMRRLQARNIVYMQEEDTHNKSVVRLKAASLLTFGYPSMT